jgi:hypothetical protein
MNNKFRPISLSENDIDNITLNIDFNLYTPLSIKPDILNDLLDPFENKQKFYTNKYFIYIFKRFLMFLIHLSLISMFETLFFFYIVSKYEDDALYNIIDSYTNNINYDYDFLNVTEKTNIYNIFTNSINIESIYNKSIVSYNKRLHDNNKLFFKTWMYFTVLCIINCILLFLNRLLILNINIKKIIIDNFFMIILLGIYEYIFLQTIILQYSNITTNELTKYIIDQLGK